MELPKITEGSAGGGYRHSIPVPRLYKCASTILQRYYNKEGTLKTLVFAAKHRNTTKLFKILYQTIDRGEAIKSVLEDSNIFHEHPRFNRHLAMVLTTELLDDRLQGDCKPVCVIKSYEETIKHLYLNLDAQKKFVKKKTSPLPRYVRINTLRASVDCVHDQLSSEGWRLQEYNAQKTTYDDFLRMIQYLDESCYLMDYHIPELLVFPPKTKFWESVLYREAAIILQDKASCLPVFLSSIKPGHNVIDGCAAPGNKTSYIAAKIDNDGSVVAVDKSPDRLQTMIQLLHERGASCVTTLLDDFTNIIPHHYPDVNCILLDPSCSGSGTDMHEDEVSKERVRSLAAFQLHLLMHALSFPSVREVIYSTCSVNREENEDVIVKALERFGDQFKLRKLKSKLPGWKHFSSDESGLGSRVLRTDPAVDRCQGFFVAKFVRRKEGKGEVQDEEVVNSGDMRDDLNCEGLESGNGMEDYNDDGAVRPGSLGNDNNNNDERKKVGKRKKSASHDTEDMASGDNAEEEMEDGSLRKKKRKKKHTNHELESDDFDTKASQDMASGDNAGEKMEDGNLRKKKGKKKHTNHESESDDFDTKTKKKKKKHSH